MKRITILAAVLFSLQFQAKAQDDLKSKLSNYFTYQSENNDTAAFNLIKSVYLSIKESNERDINILDKFVNTIDSYSAFFTECSPDEEDEYGMVTCERRAFELNQISTIILPEAFSFRAEAFLLLGDPISALKDYDAAIAALPTNASYYTNRGNVKYKIKDDAGAVDDFNKSIAIDSTNASVYFNKGLVLIRMKNFTEATKAFHLAHMLEPENTKALYYKGLSQYQDDKATEALETFNAVSEADPSNDGAYFYAGVIYYKANSFEEARTKFEMATKTDPNNSKAWYYLGISAYNLKDNTTACSAWEHAKELGYSKAGDMITKYCTQ